MAKIISTSAIHKVIVDAIGEERINEALIDAAEKVKNKIIEYTPIGENSALIDSYQISEPQDMSIEVYTNSEYAPYIEYGTGIYASAGNGRQTPWGWPATAEDVARYGIINPNSKSGNDYINVSYDASGQAYIWTIGFNPDKGRPRGGHMMERGLIDSIPDIEQVFKQLGGK